MKKFLTLLFTLAVACSLSLPVFAQEAGAQGGDQKMDKKEKKQKKEKKSKKEKKDDTTAK
jgi:hypothetical protein